jgi:hypothetical protein
MNPPISWTTSAIFSVFAMNRPSLKLYKDSKKTPDEYETPNSPESWLTEEEAAASSENDDTDLDDDYSNDDASTEYESSLDASCSSSFIDPDLSDYYTSSGDSDEYFPNPDDKSTEGSSCDDTDLSLQQSNTE